MSRNEELVALFVRDLRGKADATDDPHCVIWLALHAGAALVGVLGSFDVDGVHAHDPAHPRRP